MAYKRNYGKKQNKKPNRATELTRLAFLMGQVERGRKNPDSRITASFDAGKNSVEKKKKPLF